METFHIVACFGRFPYEVAVNVADVQKRLIAIYLMNPCYHPPVNLMAPSGRQITYNVFILER